VLTAGDRPARVNAAAAAVQSAVAAAQNAVQPHAGAKQNKWNGGPLKHGTLAGGDSIMDALRALGQAVGGLAKEVSDALGEAARKEREAADELEALQQAKVAIGIVYQPYTEPMNIPAPDISVAAVVCVRAVITSAPNEFLRPGSACDFVYHDSDTIRIREIDGFTPGDPRTITFTFVFVGV